MASGRSQLSGERVKALRRGCAAMRGVDGAWFMVRMAGILYGLLATARSFGEATWLRAAGRLRSATSRMIRTTARCTAYAWSPWRGWE
jgi:hypothetical protein